MRDCRWHSATATARTCTTSRVTNLDALAGLAVTGLGHAHPGVAAAITRQANSLMHTSNLYRISLQESLADRITKLAGRTACSSAIPARKRTKPPSRSRPMGTAANLQTARHRDGRFLSRPHDGDAYRHRQSQGSSGLRTAALRFRPRAIQRCQSDRDDRGKQQRSGRDPRRTGVGRRRHRGS